MISFRPHSAKDKSLTLNSRPEAVLVEVCGFSRVWVMGILSI
jgi:hypothetical protein